MIGQTPGHDHAWIATGFSGVGLTWGTAAAGMIADEIEGRAVPLAHRLSPARIGLSKPTAWVSEQMTTLTNFAERALPARGLDPSAILPGRGAVGKIDGQHVAFCRDREGCEHRLSPVCPHMGGVLHWNEVDQTWDCPVHGGRFSAAGERIYGPPETDMQSLSSS
jgi:Rieske Fe-S protein